VSVGTIRQRESGSFLARIYVDGKRKRRVFLTQEQAEAWLVTQRSMRTRKANQLERANLPHPGVVYFVGALPLGAHPIKIGFSSRSSDSRLVGTQVGNPLRIVTLAEIEGSRALEKWLHRAFSDNRMQGEWFEPVSSLVSLIAALRPIGKCVVIEASYRFPKSIA